MDRSRSRILPLTGVAAAVLWTVGLFLFDSAREGDLTTAEDILLSYQSNGETILLAVWAALLGSVFFVVFLSCLTTRLREAEAPGGQLAHAVFAAGTMVAVGQFAVYGSDFDAALDSTQYPLSASTAEAYFYYGDIWFIGAAAMAGLLLIAVGAIALRTRVLPAWLGVIGLVIAVPLLLPPLAPPVMLFAFPAWVVVTSLVMMANAQGARSDRPASAEPSGHATVRA
jgi:hypothetical protein